MGLAEAGAPVLVEGLIEVFMEGLFVPEADEPFVEDAAATDETVTPADLQVSAKADNASDLASPQTLWIVFCTSDACLLQIVLRSAGLSWVLTAASKHAGGEASATCATAKRKRAMVVLSCIVSCI